jgi:hypothetical protein
MSDAVTEEPAFLDTLRVQHDLAVKWLDGLSREESTCPDAAKSARYLLAALGNGPRLEPGPLGLELWNTWRESQGYGRLDDWSGLLGTAMRNVTRDRWEEIARVALTWCWDFAFREQGSLLSVSPRVDEAAGVGVGLPSAEKAAASPLPAKDLPGEEDELVVILAGSRLADAERRFIEATLRRVGGDKGLAAQLLGVSSRTLYRRMKSWSKSCPGCGAEGPPHEYSLECRGASRSARDVIREAVAKGAKAEPRKDRSP